MSTEIVNQLKDIEKKQDEAVEKTTKALKDAQDAAKAASDQVEDLKKTTTEQAEALKKELNDRFDEMEAKANEPDLKGKADNIHQNIEKELKALATDLVAMQNGAYKGGKINFAVKAAGTMTIAGNYSGGLVGLSSWDPEFARIQRRKPFLRELVRVIPMSSAYIAWAEQANPDPGVAGMVTEGTAKPQTDFDIVERNSQARKIAVYIKVSKEMLADIPFMQGEINTELMELVRLKIDEQILSGDNVAPNLRGILDVAPDFTAIAPLAGSIPNANYFDVIRASVAQIAAANFTATHLLINPADAAFMELEKDSEGRYLLPPFQSADGTRIAGLEVVENNGITAGTFVIGDMKRDTLAIREELNIQIGYENDDFTKNLVTILAEARVANYIKTNHFGAFVQGTFETAIAQLNQA